MLLGDRDYGVNFDRAIGIREVRWATRSKGFEMPSSTYFFGANPAGFWVFDTPEQLAGLREYQTKWLTQTLSLTQATWRIGFGHHGLVAANPSDPMTPFFSGHICDAFDLFVSANDGGSGWVEHCGTGFLATSLQPSSSPRPHDAPNFVSQTGGYVWVLTYRGKHESLGHFTVHAGVFGMRRS
jgi:hypothetical protein